MGLYNLYHVKIYPTTKTLHSKRSISAMLTSLLLLEGFYDFQNKIAATSVKQKPFSNVTP
jgi:hypothetical protein